MYDTTSKHQSHGRRVHWNDQFIHRPKIENHYHNSNLVNVTKIGPRLSLNASLPFQSKLNIRVQVHRKHHDDLNENEHVKASATIQKLNSQADYERFEALRRIHFTHNSMLSPNERMMTKTRADLPIKYGILPQQRQISVPVSLPIDQRLFLYIRSGDIFARC